MRSLALIILVAEAVSLGQPPPQPAILAIVLNNGVHLQIETSFGQPTGQQQLRANLEPASGNSFYRIFRDQNGLAVYAYELMVERPAGSDFRLTARPAGDTFAHRYQNADGGKPTPTLSEPQVFPPLHSGDRVPFEVFEMPGTGGKVIDTIEFNLDPARSPAQSGDRLRFSGLKVSTQGVVAGAAAPGSVVGRYAMFYLPGRGGYFFSSEPVTGRSFVQAGWIDRMRMQFTLDNETYDCVTDAPILAKSERGEIWVFHDPSYKPQGHWTDPLEAPVSPSHAPDFFTAASDSLNWWLP